MYIVSAGKPTFMMILSLMVDILRQTTATVANGTTTSAWTFNVFEIKSTTHNGNALFAANKLYENENKGLICG